MDGVADVALHDQIDADTQNERLFEGFLVTKTRDTLGVDIKGLAAHFATYDVYVYLDADNATSQSGHSVRRISGGGTTLYYLDDPDGNTFRGEFVEVTSSSADAAQRGNYVVFRGVTGDSFSLRIDDSPAHKHANQNRPSLAGIQIVGGAGRSGVVIGGDYEADVVLGDGGRVRIHEGLIVEIESTDLANSGATFDADTISTGDAGDIVLGGNGADTIAAGAGDDIVLGDNARLALFQGRIIGLEHDSSEGWQLRERHDHGHEEGHDGDHYDGNGHHGDDDWYDDDDYRYSHQHGYDHHHHDHGRRGFDPYDVPGIELLGASIGGNDTIEGGADDDLMYGQFGNDTFVFDGGLLGSDRVIEAGEEDCDEGLPNDPHDRLDFSGFVQAIDIDLGATWQQVFASGSAVNLQLTLSSSSGLEGLLGSAYGDEIEGNSRDNFLYGLGGADEIEGEDGDDLLDGGDGDDELYGDCGDDILHGGAGNDTLRGGDDEDVLYGDAGNDKLYGDNGDDLLAGGTGNDRIEGGSGHDLLFFPGATTGVSVNLTSGGNGTSTDGLGGSDELRTSIDGAIGTVFADVLKGDETDNEFRGMGGNDFIDGRGGHDLLDGGEGDDEIIGGWGCDTLLGGEGNDKLWGGDDDDLIDGRHRQRLGRRRQGRRRRAVDRG
jgi:Ca2+-binding RTX toxin-like protein